MVVVSRRQALAWGASALVAGSLPQPLFAQSLAPVVTGLNWIPNVEYGGMWIGLEQGYFAAEGIDLSFLPGGPNAPSPLVSLASGAVNYGHTDWAPFLEARAKGNDFVIVGAGFPTSPVAILSLAARPVKEPKDLLGARVLGPGDNTSKLMVEAILQSVGLPPDFEMISTGFSPEPLLAGDGDAYVCFATNQPIIFEQMGLVRDKDFFVTLLDDLGYRTPGGIMVARRDYLEQNRALVVGYLRALARGWRDNATDPTVAAKLAVEKYGADFGLSYEQQLRQNELQIPLVTLEGGPGPLWFDVADIYPGMVEIAKASGHAEVEPASVTIDLGPLEEALASI